MSLQTHFRSFFKSISNPELFSVSIILIFGTIMVFMIPLSAGYDEETHLARAWEMANLEFIPNEKLGSELPFPGIYYELSYRRLKLVTALPPEFTTEYASLPLDAYDYIYGGEFDTRSVYSPPLLAPQALVLRYFGLAWNLPALTVFYLCRFAGLFSYLILVWLTVRWIPFGKWVMAVLAVAPMTLFQASTVTTDAISNGLALLFISGSLASASSEQIDWKRWWQLGFLFFILFFGKVNIAPLAILPFLIIPPSKFKNKNQYILLIALTVILFLIEVVGWNAIAYSRLTTAQERANPSGQLAFILSHPLNFLWILIRNFWQNSLGHLQGWLALYGYNYWPVPQIVSFLFPIAIVAALIKDSNENIPVKTRWALLIVFILSYIATVSSLYISFTPVGSMIIEGVQGRYFFPVMPFLFLALIGLPKLNRSRNATSLVIVSATAGLVFYAVGLILSYHVSCGSQYYRTDLCYQPNYKNFAPRDRYSEPISNDLTLTQEFVPECGGVTELRFWVNSTDSEKEATTQFTLQDHNRAVDVFNAQIPNDQFPQEGWYTLSFDPDWESSGKLYTLSISSNSVPGNGLRVAYSLKPEYLDGKLYENEQNLSQDVIFQYGCVAGLRKIWFEAFQTN